MSHSQESEAQNDQIPQGRKKPRRGIYLLPNLFTTASLFAGFYSIVSAINGEYLVSAVVIFIAMILDFLDGGVARLTNTQSDFGKEYDSLTDMVVFGVTPAVVMYEWALSTFDPDIWVWSQIGWLAAFFYCACAALRLARFNAMTTAGKEEKGFFLGMPSPSAAAMVMGLVWCGTHNGYSGEELAYWALPVTLAAGAFMVSNIRFRSLKDIRLEGSVPFTYLLIVVGVFALIATSPANVLFAAAMIYAVSGPLGSLLRRRKKNA